MDNKLPVEVLINEYGSEPWREIQERCDAATGFFIGMEQYPDEVTYSIVGAASEIVGISAEQLLDIFGKKWVELTAKGEFGNYYAMADNSIDFPDNHYGQEITVAITAEKRSGADNDQFQIAIV